MRGSRRAIINACLVKGGFAIPTFSGSYAVFGDETKGYMELYSSGTLTFSGDATVDIFAVAGGASGSKGSTASSKATSGAGGNSGNKKTVKGVSVSGSYDVQIGSTAAATSVGSLVNVSGVLSYGGGGAVTASDDGTYVNGESGYVGVYPFNDSTFNRVAGSGGSGGAVKSSASASITANGGAGGAGGGGTGGTAKRLTTGTSTTNATNGAENTGGGGGGGSAVYSGAFNKTGNAGSGGSGIVIVRWGYAA